MKNVRLTICLVVVCVMAVANFASAALVAQWDFNGTAADDSGNGYNGIVYGATLTSDRFGNPNSAYNFDGVDDYIDIPGSENLNFGSGFTLSAWVRFSSYNYDTAIVNKHRSGLGSGYTLGIRQDRAFLYVNDGGPISPYSETINDGEWHCLTGVYNAAIQTQYLYVDGNLVDQVSNTPYTLFNSETIRIGGLYRGISNGAFVGDIDDIRIYEIPEPATLLLLGLGGLLLRRKNT